LRTKPSLTEVSAAYPREWEQARRELERVAAAGDPDRVVQYLAAAARPTPATPGRARPAAELRSAAIRRYLMIEATRQASLAQQAGPDRRGRKRRPGNGGSVDEGAPAVARRLRLGLVTGFVLQRLLFTAGLRRKPAALPLVRAIWPLLPGRGLLLPLVQPKGIYCFYSRRLITDLARLIGDRTCLEIAAGDGTLARFLHDRGVQIRATDDLSWRDTIEYGAEVEALDAARALRRHRSEVVICSWPPPGNDFERRVFETPEVQLYIVLAGVTEAAAGNWATYRAQHDFEMTLDQRLSAGLLPPGAGAAYVFRRSIHEPGSRNPGGRSPGAS
jgi:hypothetical protein